MNIYILPNSETSLGGRFFERDPLVDNGGYPNVAFWNDFVAELMRQGYCLYTTDAWTPEKSRPDDILVVMNHPGETVLWRLFYLLKNFRKKGGFVFERRSFLFENYKKFSKRILLQGEPPMVMPYVYGNLAQIKNSGIYGRIFLICKGFGEEFGYTNFFENMNDDLTSPYFDEPKDKFLTMVNGNLRPRTLRDELYGERLKAIKYFSAIPGFDLYGYGWDKRPRHPLYPFYGRYVRRVWRGSTSNKIKTHSRYKFAIVIENCAYDGYFTEKVYDVMAAGSIPAYLGASDVETHIPADCFIDLRKFKDYAELEKFLSAMPEGERERRRESIRTFLKSRTKEPGIRAFIGKMLA